MRNLNPTELKRLNRDWRRRTERPIALLLDGVQTPYNVGSIVRAAASFRVDHLWLAGATASPADAKSRKTSLGTERFLTWSAAPTGAGAAEQARAEGYLVVGIELASGAVPLAEVDLPADRPVCLALGHEDHGLAAATLRACDAVAYVPTPGRVGSLNVAVCAGIALYEIRRREWVATPPESSGPSGVGSSGPSGVRSSGPSGIDGDA